MIKSQCISLQPEYLQENISQVSGWQNYNGSSLVPSQRNCLASQKEDVMRNLCQEDQLPFTRTPLAFCSQATSSQEDITAEGGCQMSSQVTDLSPPWSQLQGSPRFSNGGSSLTAAQRVRMASQKETALAKLGRRLSQDSHSPAASMQEQVYLCSQTLVASAWEDLLGGLSQFDSQNYGDSWLTLAQRARMADDQEPALIEQRELMQEHEEHIFNELKGHHHCTIANSQQSAVETCMQESSQLGNDPLSQSRYGGTSLTPAQRARMASQKEAAVARRKRKFCKEDQQPFSYTTQPSFSSQTISSQEDHGSLQGNVLSSPSSQLSIGGSSLTAAQRARMARQKEMALARRQRKLVQQSQHLPKMSTQEHQSQKGAAMTSITVECSQQHSSSQQSNDRDRRASAQNSPFYLPSQEDAHGICWPTQESAMEQKTFDGSTLTPAQKVRMAQQKEMAIARLNARQQQQQQEQHQLNILDVQRAHMADEKELALAKQRKLAQEHKEQIFSQPKGWHQCTIASSQQSAVETCMQESSQLENDPLSQSQSYGGASLTPAQSWHGEPEGSCPWLCKEDHRPFTYSTQLSFSSQTISSQEDHVHGNVLSSPFSELQGSPQCGGSSLTAAQRARMGRQKEMALARRQRRLIQPSQHLPKMLRQEHRSQKGAAMTAISVECSQQHSASQQSNDRDRHASAQNSPVYLPSQQDADGICWPTQESAMEQKTLDGSTLTPVQKVRMAQQKEIAIARLNARQQQQQQEQHQPNVLGVQVNACDSANDIAAECSNKAVSERDVPTNMMTMERGLPDAMSLAGHYNTSVRKQGKLGFTSLMALSVKSLTRFTKAGFWAK